MPTLPNNWPNPDAIDLREWLFYTPEFNLMLDDAGMFRQLREFARVLAQNDSRNYSGTLPPEYDGLQFGSHPHVYWYRMLKESLQYPESVFSDVAPRQGVSLMGSNFDSSTKSVPWVWIGLGAVALLALLSGNKKKRRK